MVEHTPTDADQALASLCLLTSLGAEILTAHDADQWREVSDAHLIHSA